MGVSHRHCDGGMAHQFLNGPDIDSGLIRRMASVYLLESSANSSPLFSLSLSLAPFRTSHVHWDIQYLGCI